MTLWRGFFHHWPNNHCSAFDLTKSLAAKYVLHVCILKEVNKYLFDIAIQKETAEDQIPYHSLPTSAYTFTTLTSVVICCSLHAALYVHHITGQLVQQ